jgi:hypothetical protein
LPLARCSASGVVLSVITALNVGLECSNAPVSTDNTFQDLPRLHETVDNTERYMFFYGATARGGPWPPLQYASKPLDPLLYLSIRLFPSFSGL